jgi:hypothetical protein
MSTPSGRFSVGYTDMEFAKPGYTASEKQGIDPDKVTLALGNLLGQNYFSSSVPR